MKLGTSCFAYMMTTEKAIPLSVKDKTAYEAVNNHVHLLDDISDEEFSKLAVDAPILCRLIYNNIKAQYPQKEACSLRYSKPL